MLRQEPLNREFLMEFYIVQLPKHPAHFDELIMKCPPPLAHASNACSPAGGTFGEMVETSARDSGGRKQVAGGAAWDYTTLTAFFLGLCFLLVRKHLSFTTFFHHGGGGF